MTSKEQRQFWFKWSRFQKQYEKVYTKKFVEALQIQVKSYISARDVMAIPSYPIYNVILDLYKNVGPRWVLLNKKMYTKQAGQMGVNEEIVELMRRYYGIDLLNDAELMTEFSRRVIVSVLNEAASLGWSIDKITEELLKHPEFNKTRAMRIARTETVTAANGASMIYALKSGLKLNKVWIAVKDKRTRDSHKNTDGSVVDYNEPFSVNGVSMMQPGVRVQPNGLPVPAKEIVNCRCTVAFIPKRDETGRLVR